MKEYWNIVSPNMWEKSCSFVIQQHNSLFDRIFNWDQELMNWLLFSLCRICGSEFLCATNIIGLFVLFVWKRENKQLCYCFSPCFQFLQFQCATSALNRSFAIGLCLWKSGICPSYASDPSPAQRRERAARPRALPRQQTTVQQVVVYVCTSVCECALGLPKQRVFAKL